MDTAPFITSALMIAGHSFVPDELTALIGIKPTRVWHQKLQWLKALDPSLPTIGWEYELEKQDKQNIGEAIDEILEALRVS